MDVDLGRERPARLGHDHHGDGPRRIAQRRPPRDASRRFHCRGRGCHGHSDHLPALRSRGCRQHGDWLHNGGGDHRRVHYRSHDGNSRAESGSDNAGGRGRLNDHQVRQFELFLGVHVAHRNVREVSDDFVRRRYAGQRRRVHGPCLRLLGCRHHLTSISCSDEERERHEKSTRRPAEHRAAKDRRSPGTAHRAREFGMGRRAIRADRRAGSRGASAPTRPGSFSRTSSRRAHHARRHHALSPP